MDTAKLLSSVPTGLWIGGEERQGSSTFDVLDPSDDKVLISVANATAEDAVAALDAACAVQADWAATPPRERGEILRAVFEKITDRAEDLAQGLVIDIVVMPLQGLPCGSGGDVGNLRGIGGHVADTNAAKCPRG